MRLSGYLLFPLSLLLGALLLPIGFLWGVVACFYQRQWRQGIVNLDDKLLFLAKAIDKYGNAACAEWFNALLITPKSQHRFGNISQTISAVVGYNLIAGTLTPLGLRVNGWLDALFGKNHSVDAAKSEELLLHLQQQKERIPL